MPQPSRPHDRDGPPVGATDVATDVAAAAAGTPEKGAPETGAPGIGEPRGSEGRTLGRPPACPPDGKDRHPDFEPGRELRPIGPERLRQLRESILNGTYPLDERAGQGLTRMFLGHAPRPSDPEGDAP